MLLAWTWPKPLPVRALSVEPEDWSTFAPAANLRSTTASVQAPRWTSFNPPFASTRNRDTAEVLGTAMQFASLNDISRRMLMESFRVGRAMQQWLQLDYMR
jgi:hypothetical protein